jgi:hypothetical protein
VRAKGQGPGARGQGPVGEYTAKSAEDAENRWMLVARCQMSERRMADDLCSITQMTTIYG